MPSHEALRDYCIDQMQTNGYVALGYDLRPADIDPLFHDFRELLTDIAETPTERGQAIINAFHVETPGRPQDGIGYLEQRRIGVANRFEPGSTPGTENKDVLHFLPTTEPHAREYLALRGGMPKLADRVIKRCTDIHEAVKSSVRPIFQVLGIEDTMLAPERLRHQDVHLVRVIRYLGNTAAVEPQTFIARDELAELHFDRSKFTAAVWESASGLVGSAANNSVGQPNLTVEELDHYAERTLATPLKHRSGAVKLFAGAGYNHLTEAERQASGNLPLLLHGVLDDTPGQERDAVVVFINHHRGVSTTFPGSHEKGFDKVRAHVEEKQIRHGGLVA